MRRTSHRRRHVLLLLLLALFASLCTTASTAVTSHDRRVHAELVRVMPGNPGAADVALTWQSFDNNAFADSATQLRVDAVGNRDPVTMYEAQVAVSGSGDWRALAFAISGLRDVRGAPHTDVHERQRVSTRADAGATITDGFFRLTLSHAGVSDLDVQQRSVTPPIPFDATESQMKAALESLDVVSRVQVFRQASTTTVGGFEWTILFDPVAAETPARTLDRGELPLLILYAETISATWSGPGDQVTVASVREAALDHVVCANECVFDALGLPTGETLAFRVRAHYTFLGWSEWSDASEPLLVPPTMLPRAPTRPELIAATAERITVKWKYEAPDARFPVRTYHLQQQCDNDLGWFTVDAHVVPGAAARGFTVASSTARPPNSSCVFRVAATTANGVGPFSAQSQPLRTRATVPDAPQQLVVQRSPLVLTWTMPLGRGGGSAVVAFDVQYRPRASSTWLQAPTNAINVANRSFAFDAPALLAYTRYAVRVRARNSVGLSAFSNPVDFLTEYRVPLTDAVAANISFSSSATGSRPIAILKSASRELAANTVDRYYVRGIAGGGVARADGDPGLVVLFPLTRRGDRLAELAFFFTGSVQQYRVPVSHTSDPMMQIVAVDVYVWGAGGGSGDKSAINTYANGGGGAFARGVFAIAPADTLNLIVGGGGRGSASAARQTGMGGYHGGGDAGRGDFPGGGGGGASEVRVNGKTVLVAAGGGGGGATDYCCAHGGGGGGDKVAPAEAGAAPNSSTIPLGLIEVQHTMRDVYEYKNIVGDVVTFTDALARHAHLDYGFAGSSADFSVLATGGTGASIVQAGRGGRASSYRYGRTGKFVLNDRTSVLEVTASLAAFTASSGRSMVGGKGQDGKDSGGGGGSGYFGGGGGGAGIDAGGGGGGSSFIATTALTDVTDVTQSRISATWSSHNGGERVEAFSAQAVSPTAVALHWSPPTRLGSYSHDVVGFVVEMANRSASEDFRVVRTERASADAAAAMTVTVRGLEASRSYRFRVKVLFRDVVGAYSDVASVVLPAHAANVWRRVTGGVRSFSAETVGAGLRYTDPAPLQRFPSPRRGHALVLLDTHLFMFGGFARGDRCNAAHKAACELAADVTNELWRFDLTTKIWMEVVSKEVTAVIPPSREKHSAVVVDSRVLVFGGRMGGADGAAAALNDLWELSVTSITQRTAATLQDRETSLAIGDGKELFTIGNVGHAPSLCVASLRVRLRVTHACMQTLHITLLGPGPSTFPQRQQNDMFPVNSQATETTWSDADGVGIGTSKRATPTAAAARSFSVTLQTPTMFATDMPCQSGTRDLVFESTGRPFAGGDRSSSDDQPLEALSVFHSLSASGGWTLSVADTAFDGHEGTLEFWDIAFVLVPCATTFEWRQLNAAAGVRGSPPTARFQHAAIVYRNSMFVLGGRSGASGQELNDLYRLDYSSAIGGSVQWTQLVSATAATSSEQRFYLGRVTLLTAYDLLAVGNGLRSPRRNAGVAHHFTSGLYVGQKSVLDDRHGWMRVPIASDDIDNVAPAPRYWSASAFVPDTPSIEPGAATTVGGARPRLYMFGGQDDTGLLDDFWQLELDAVAEVSDAVSLQTRRREVCDWRLASTAHALKWAASCNATAVLVAQSRASECDVHTLLLYAWCGEFYQSVAL